MRKKTTTLILLLILLAGLSLLLYPAVSDYWNSFHQSRAIADYTAKVEEMDEADYEAMRRDAAAYNQKLLADTGNRYRMTEAQEKEYESLLDVTGTGIMGYVEIPKLKTSLPIYHGTDEGVLQIAIGHLAGSSLPTGGEGTHCVLTGHRGLPSAKLFTNLDEMEEGDLFTLRVLDETLTYETDQIRIVEPQEMEDLEIEAGKDYCTLVTCTPYGVNSHRLLVRGHRVETSGKETLVPADAVQIDRLLAAPAVGAVLLLLVTAAAILRRRIFLTRNKKKGSRVSRQMSARLTVKQKTRMRRRRAKRQNRRRKRNLKRKYKIRKRRSKRERKKALEEETRKRGGSV